MFVSKSMTIDVQAYFVATWNWMENGLILTWILNTQGTSILLIGLKIRKETPKHYLWIAQFTFYEYSCINIWNYTLDHGYSSATKKDGAKYDSV